MGFSEHDNRRGDWMQTFTGKQFWVLDPLPEEVDPVDIAHGLSMQCRYNGHVDYFYSVAEHCVLMSEAVPEEFSLWALLHDATEAYVGDMVRPLKINLPIFSAYEDRVMKAIAQRFGLKLVWDPRGWVLDSDHGITMPKIVMPAAVKEADSRILLTERDALMTGKSPAAWGQDGLDPLNVTIQAWDPSTAKEKYLDRLDELLDLRMFGR